jgi:DNA-binding NarL/FixJ family response regulator
MTLHSFGGLGELNSFIAGPISLRILIVDLEYLVAMEAERILTENFTCETVIVMPRDYPEVLDSQKFDVVLIHASLVRRPEAVQQLTMAEAGIVLTTLISEEVEGIPEWPGVAVVSKPFEDRRLVEAIKNAARD